MKDKLAHLPKFANAVKPEPPAAESKLQAKCVDSIQNWYPELRGRFFCINNNAENGFKGAQLKAMGITEGVADTCFICEGGTVIWIEFKRPLRKGGQSDCQIEWQAMVEDLGHRYVLCNNYRHFWTIVDLPNPEPNFTLF